ncbi:hypothetical protein BD324DRAFT_123476 [Kockovaella imperatae]|uniref:Uncharacterized protein n=1 Tax=Kockovaella imperatae TaxID=4999 RepID=A0A1Y1U9B8_9TREE|nr:hypothetical protein BD324DRAFT_123476 [Kockovaella imperatae]ORX34630.1 hypothetical protein BD324DRAFT_123476 [Kockovaella imperatae]
MLPSHVALRFAPSSRAGGGWIFPTSWPQDKYSPLSTVKSSNRTTCIHCTMQAMTIRVSAKCASATNSSYLNSCQLVGLPKCHLSTPIPIWRPLDLKSLSVTMN